MVFPLPAESDVLLKYLGGRSKIGQLPGQVFLPQIQQAFEAFQEVVPIDVRGINRHGSDVSSQRWPMVKVRHAPE
jgi:hypothetical protein